MLVLAKRLLLEPGTFLRDAAFRVERGRVTEVLASPGRPAGRTLELNEGFVAPGFVNAHAHLELGCLAGRLDGRGGMIPWIRGVIEARRELTADDFRRAWRSGASKLLATGTTTVGDIDSSGACETEGATAALRSVCYREVLDGGDPARTASVLRRVSRALPVRRRLLEGISPHAPYSVSPELMARCAVLARRRELPIAVHWAELAEEEPWIRAGEGPLGEILPLPRRLAPDGALDELDKSGLLHGRTALIHGNHPARGDAERIARAGAAVVHCPGTHRFFGRAAFPLDGYRTAGVRIALGTDSLASNEVLDMGREMALAHEHTDGVTADELLGWATVGGAHALGLGERLGRLAPGFEADFVQHDHEPADAREAALALVAPARCLRTWVGGREAWARQNA